MQQSTLNYSTDISDKYNGVGFKVYTDYLKKFCYSVKRGVLLSKIFAFFVQIEMTVECPEVTKAPGISQKVVHGLGGPPPFHSNFIRKCYPRKNP